MKKTIPFKTLLVIYFTGLVLGLVNVVEAKTKPALNKPINVKLQPYQQGLRSLLTIDIRNQRAWAKWH